MMQLRFADETNCVFNTADGGSITNRSNFIVIRRMPDPNELKALFREFEVKFREALVELLSMPWGEIERKYGSIGKLRKDGSAERADQMYCFLREPARNYLLVINSVALAGHLGGMTANGTRRRKYTNMGHSPDDAVKAMTWEQKTALVRDLAEGDLDELIRLDINSKLGWADLETRVERALSSEDFLYGLALEIEDFVSNQKVGGDGRRGSGRHYATAWFGQFLAAKGLWLFPQTYCASIRYFYPARLRPILAWMSVPKELQSLADLVTVIDADRAKSSLTYCLNAFITAGLSSDMWRDHRLCTAPLEWMKKEVASQTESKPNSNLSSSINRVYLALLEQFGVKSIDRPEAHIFLRRKRLHSVGNSGLRWCFEPNKKNTRLAKKILGREVTSVPWFVQNLAREFEETLRYFEVIHVKQIEAGLNAFLIYVMTLDEADAPKNLVEIDREKHINDLSEHGNTFRNFLTDNFSESGRDCGSRAMGTVQKAWRFSSELNGFGKTIANPIDMSTDNPIKYRKKGAKSTRHAIMDEVFQIILWENVRDDYAFARTLDFLYQTVRLPGSDVFKRLFWPAQPLILEACARSATRGKSARFADSGEGDEFRYDPDLLQMVVNTGKHATVGRQMGLIQSMAIFTDGGRREVPTLYVASGKTGDYAVPYVDPDFARRFTEFTRLQEEYNPVDGASLALDTRHHSDHSYLGEVANVYVAFRELNLGYVTAISPERITSYLVALLTHCEPIVEKALGYPYPLVRDGNPLIQLHAFRVTANTRLQARGGTREDARILLGHKTALYADYYNNPPLVDNYTRIANAAALDREITRPEPNAALIRYAEEQEAIYGGPTRSSVQLREADASGRRVDFLNHGICTGECSTGGPIVNGRPTPVWRNRACAKCSNRASGPPYLAELAIRVNCLSWEIRQSYKRSAQLNEDMDTASSRGQSTRAIETALKAEQQLRSNLDEEQQSEIFNIKKYELAATELGDNAIFGPASGHLDRDLVEFREVHEFELLQSLVRNLDLRPSLRIDFDPGIELEWERVIHTVARANSLHDVIYQIPGTARQQLIATGDAILERVDGVSELQRMIDNAFASESYPPLLKWKSAIRKQLTTPALLIKER